jgi:hypothetical protein
VAKDFINKNGALARTGGLTPSCFTFIKSDIERLKPSQLMMTPSKRESRTLVYSFDIAYGPPVRARKELLLRHANAFRILTCKKEDFENEHWTFVGQQACQFYGENAGSASMYCFERQRADVSSSRSLSPRRSRPSIARSPSPTRAPVVRQQQQGAAVRVVKGEPSHIFKVRVYHAPGSFNLSRPSLISRKRCLLCRRIAPIGFGARTTQQTSTTERYVAAHACGRGLELIRRFL